MPIIIPSSGSTSSIAPSSLSDMKTRIARELHRDDLTTDIASAISSAITKYQSKRFEFADGIDAFSTVANQESYTNGDTGFPTDIGQIDLVKVTYNGRSVPLEPITYNDLKRLSTTTSLTNVPSMYAWYDRALWLYPVPNGVYTITLSHEKRNAPPASDADSTTVWTNECEALIRACAKKLVARDVMWDDQLAARCEAEENEAYASLMTDSIQLQDDGSPLAAHGL